MHIPHIPLSQIRCNHCVRRQLGKALLGLSGFAKVVGWSERRSIGGMEVDFEPAEQRLSCVLEPFEVVPPAMAGELVFEVAPEALNQVELRRVGW